MRYFLSAIAFIAALLPCNAENTNVVWLDTLVHMGTFHEEAGKMATHFRAVNTGYQLLIISNARATCGCTRPDYDPHAVAPGDTAVISVSYDPAGRPGHFSKKIYVDMNTQPSKHTLLIEGTVIASEATAGQRYPDKRGSVRLKQPSLPFGVIKKGDIRSTYLEAYNCSTDTLRPRLKNIPANVHAYISPLVVPPGEQLIVSASFNASNAPMLGFVTDSLTFVTNEAESFAIPISATVDEDFSSLSTRDLETAPYARYSSTSIDFGSTIPETRTAIVTITNEGKKPLKIHRAYCMDGIINVSLPKQTKLRTGESCDITLELPAEAMIGREIINTILTVITNSPDNSRQDIRITAEINQP